MHTELLATACEYAERIEIVLSPVQQLAVDCLFRNVSIGAVIGFQAESGMGRTTILRRLRHQTGAAFVDAGDFIEAIKSGHALAIEENVLQPIRKAMGGSDLIVVDDFHLVQKVVDHYNYSRQALLNIAVTALLSEAAIRGKVLVFGQDEERFPEPIDRRCFSYKLEAFKTSDYECICRSVLNGHQIEQLDFAQIHQFAPGLDAYQLRNVCAWLNRHEPVTTQAFIDYLVSCEMATNVEIAEVAPVQWSSLRGLEDIVRALEIKIALPLENRKLAEQFRLKPKRGVLLAGPPGTGKTTIGRALAHRLKSKFFLVDGTIVASDRNFFCSIKRIFDSAKRNAPSIVFIDDADVLFEGDNQASFYRYLLTLLDGIESVSSERVCVMMTAMEPSRLPMAVLRSGRIELWLETRLPDQQARKAIFGDLLTGAPPPFPSADFESLAGATKGLTGADIKAIIEDAKLLFVHQNSKAELVRPLEEYFREAIAELRRNHRRYKKHKPVRSEPACIGFNAVLED